MKHNLTEKFLKKEYILNKKSASEIAKITYSCITTIYKYLKKYKIKTRRAKRKIRVDKITKNLILKEYIKNNKNIKELAQFFECDCHVISNCLKKFQIKKNIKFTLEHRKKLSEVKRGKKRLFSKKHKKNLSKALKGRKLTKSWKNNISKANKGKTRTIEHIKKLHEGLKKSRKEKGMFSGNKKVNHHIYLKENNNKTIKMTRKKHRQLHARAYDYIYYKYGEKGIDNYLKWFKGRY